jgi:hypothetical protein
MAFTGDEHYGWRVATFIDGHNTSDGTGRWVDEVVIELVKGQRHIECKGQHGIDPAIVLNRALSAALLDDIREAVDQNEDTSKIVDAYRRHEIQREVNENGWIAKRIGDAIFRATTIGTGAGG